MSRTIVLREFRKRDGDGTVFAARPADVVECAECGLEVSGDWTPGCWVVEDGRGGYQFVSHDAFSQTYEPVG